MNDPIGEAIHDFFEKGKAPAIIVNSNYTGGEEIQPSYFFRKEKEMPDIEKKALKLCRGKILDVGAAAGCHSLILQKNDFNVIPLEKSPLAAEVLRKRGLLKVIQEDVFSYSGNGFDTVLVLMNGCGIGKTISGLEKLLVHIKTFLTPTGQILIDSSDIKYLFTAEDGSYWEDLANQNYYGEMEYEVIYKESKSIFKWLFIDFENLKEVAKKAGLDCNVVANGNHFDYLVQLTLKS